jgi:phage terminase Nu1 subunit (DNA packaging protein)
MSQLVTAPKLAELWGVSRTQIYNLAKRGIIDEPEGGKFDLVKCTTAYIKYLRTLAENTGSATLASERTRKAREEADKLEDEKKLRRGEVATLTEIQRAIEQDYAAIRARLLPLPTRLTQRVPKKYRAEVLEAGEVIIHDLLNELASGRDIQISKGDTKAPAKARSKPVGGRKKVSKPRG